MSRFGSFDARRVRLVALTGAAALLAVALVATTLLLGGARHGRHEAAIRDALDRSAVAASYELGRLDGTAGDAPRYRLVLRLPEEIDEPAVGSLLSTLFEDPLRVAQIDLTVGDGRSLALKSMHREPSEWAQMLDYAASLLPGSASLTQLGPAGMAVYRLDLDATAADPMSEYESLLHEARPEWVSLGHVRVGTPPGEWPKHRIDTGRPLTAAEIERFRELDERLAATISPGDKYVLRVTARLGDDRAEFVSRVIPLVPSPPIDSSAPSGQGGSAPESPAPAEPAPIETGGSSPAVEDPPAPEPAPTAPDSPAPAPEDQGASAPEPSESGDTAGTTHTPPDSVSPDGQGASGTPPAASQPGRPPAAERANPQGAAPVAPADRPRPRDRADEQGEQGEQGDDQQR